MGIPGIEETDLLELVSQSESWPEVAVPARDHLAEMGEGNLGREGRWRLLWSGNDFADF